MNADVVAVFIPICAILGGVTLVGVRMLIKHKERLAELSAYGGGQSGATQRELETRVARLEQTIETMSLEIERNGEAQRYLTKVLAKHLPAEAQASLPR